MPLSKRVVIAEDEGIRPDIDVASLGRLAPAFEANGSITAGNASQISDGAAAVIVTTLDHADSLGVEPLAEIVSHGQVAGPDTSLLFQPSNAIKKSLQNTDLNLSNLELFEINEAFAAVALASTQDLGVPEDVVNVNGGAIALGHPIGASGTRILVTLIHEMIRQNKAKGCATLCIGGGMGIAICVEKN